jgi:hypothetical protein
MPRQGQVEVTVEAAPIAVPAQSGKPSDIALVSVSPYRAVDDHPGIVSLVPFVYTIISASMPRNLPRHGLHRVRQLLQLLSDDRF